MPLSKKEASYRIGCFRKKLEGKSLQLALILSPINIFYFTGTFARGVLLIGLSQTKLLVNRPFERAKKESLIECEYLKSLKDLPTYIKSFNSQKTIGIEKNFLNLEEYFRYQEILSNWELEGIDFLLMKTRMVKTPYEINCIKKAGEILDRALKIALNQIKPGMKEIEASALIEKELRISGHPGITRSLYGFELTYGHLISGKESLIPIYAITGQGGRGIPGFQGGASFKKIKNSDPILIDFSGYFEGYYIDQTRMASFKPLKIAETFYKTSLKILNTLEKEIKPGIKCGEVYEKAQFIVKNEKLEEFFMAHGGKVKFIGHGVGLQIDEVPVLALGQKTPLKENMVIALEPKFHVPNLGVIGIEETFVVTKRGLKKLNYTLRDWIFLK
uniref:Aminopeptidase P family protein n=1 Tax=Thermodesulfobacterium geofontis TaxID=1295609 RepID=A0A7V5N200_9BACT